MKKRNKKEVTPQIVCEFLVYEAATGEFVWLARADHHFDCPADALRWNVRYAGTPAFKNVGAGGYRISGIFKNGLYGHRVAWAYVHGYWPSVDVDHINRDRSDNRLENLRLATRSENCRNGSAHIDSATGLKGVRINGGKGKRYTAYIYVNGRSRRLGNYNDPLDAQAAYVAAAEREFGKFATDGSRL